jgi:uncharacterized membrane protein (UPF0182 family)
MPRRLPGSTRRFRITILIAIVALIILVASLRGLAGFWTDYLWFQSVGFTSVFRGVLLTKLLLALVFIGIFFGMMLGNLYIADRFAPEEVDPAQANALVVRYRDYVFPRARWVRIGVSAVFALLAGWGASREWNNWDLFRYHVSFGVKDPEYHRDIGFYVFQLPFIKFLIGWFFEALVVVLIVTIVAHYLNGAILPQASEKRSTTAVKIHLSVLLGVLALIKGVDYYFQRLELVLSRSHIVNGATATSVHADQPARTLLIAIAVIAAGLFLYNIRQKGWMLPAVAVGLWVLVYLIVGVAYPALYQALRVNPSELSRESAYITRNIDATRAAYNLTNVKTDSNYSYNPTVSSSEVQGVTPQALVNQQTLANVRLLDPAVNLLNTFDKYQGLRSYYSFNDLDLDRYSLDSGTSQPQETATVASVRELNSSVPSGFVNQRLEYTHGYGAVVAPIGQNGVNGDGTPSFTLSGLPASGQPTLNENGSEIYYGEGPNTSGFVIADSKTAELDYENTTTGQEVTNKYSGGGGVSAGSLVRRAAFALRFGDLNFILSGQITPSSKVIYYRNVVQMAQKAAPFLKFDSDPYAVVLNKQVYWVLDAYTTTDSYPYSQNANTNGLPGNSGLNSTFNYVSNSVKVVVNAYTGKMDFFVMNGNQDNNDPIIRVYEKAFPDLFKPVNEAEKLIPGITAHFRYPEDLFRVQSNMFGRYHLTTANAFYTQAQAWAISPDPGSGPLTQNTVPFGTQVGASPLVAPTVQRLQPQYILAHSPGSASPTLTFMLLASFVPASTTTSSQNLTGFMTASSDPGTYGQLTLYTTPPSQTVPGPALVSNAIRSNPQISSELTLYNEQGSQVELGEVDVVPIDNTLMYVQPVYVESSSNQIPTLRDVVVVYNGTAYHSQNASLDNALCAITNPDKTKPFSSYCNTPNAQSQLPTLPTNAGSTPSSPSQTTPSTSTTTTVPPTTAPAAGVAPPAGSTVESLLGQANLAFTQAQADLKSGNLAGYQANVEKAQKLVEEAQKLAAKKP